MKRLLPILLLLLASSAFAAGSSVTWSRKDSAGPGNTFNRLHTATVVSDDAAGTASGTTTMHGYLVRIVAVPNGGGTQPTDAYDCVLNDADGTDLAGGAVYDRSNASAQTSYPLAADATTIFPRVDGTVTLSCSNMGNSKGATIRFYVQE